jgi:hypothetical protein
LARVPAAVIAVPRAGACARRGTQVSLLPRCRKNFKTVSMAEESGARKQGGKEVFFFEKKNQKTFSFAAAARRTLHRLCAAPVAKVFASFFKKKRFLPSHPVSTAWPARR